MVEVSTDTADSLDEIADDHEVEEDEVREVFREKFENVQEKAGDGVDDDYVESLALRATRTNFNAKSSVPTNAVEMLTIGGSIREWNSGDTFVGKALVDVAPNESGRNFLSTVIIDGSEVNLSQVQDAFSSVGNIVVGEFAVSEAHTDDFRVLNSSEDTEIDVTFPDDRSEMIQEIREVVPEFSIENIADNLSQTERTEDGDVYPASFGVDIRRITADIYDGYKNPSKNQGTYTVRDDTVFDEDDIVESVVFDQEEAGENATPGLTCWTDPSLMEYASSSVVELYGTVTKDENGIVNMNVDGIIPILDEGEFDGYEDNSSEEGPERDTNSNVDRTSI